MNKFMTAMNRWLKICSEPFNIEDAEEKRKEEFKKLNETIDDVHAMLQRNQEERRLKEAIEEGTRYKNLYFENHSKIEEYKAVYPFIQTTVETYQLFEELRQGNLPHLPSFQNVNLKEAEALLYFLKAHSWPIVSVEFLDLAYAAWLEPEKVYAIITDEEERKDYSIKHSLYVFALKIGEGKNAEESQVKQIENEESERGTSL